MLRHLILFICSALLFPIIDYLWLGLVMKSFYLSQLGDLARVENGTLQPVMGAAVGVYLALALGVVVLVLPLAQTSVVMAFVYGAVLGLSVYGTYDLTNLALLRNWPLAMSIVDIAWGTFLCGLVSGLTHLINGWISQAFFQNSI